MKNIDMYDNRFTDLNERNRVWITLIRHFFQKYIKPSDSVLDFGCGYCEFINNVNCKTKYALDSDSNFKKYAGKNVNFITGSNNAKNLDKVFISNVFEHMTKEDIYKTIKLFNKILKKGGQVLVLQPNIRFAYKDYWMFFDHITAVDDRALEEIFEYFKFRLIKKHVKFVPYTTKSKFLKSTILIRIYLKFPFFWQFLGKQSFLVFEK